MRIKKISKKLKLKISINILIMLILIFIGVFIYDKITANKQNKELNKIASEFKQNIGNEGILDIELNGNKIIGIIKIEKINIEYPIIEYKNEDSLDISISRYAGPNINEIGNLCLIGHNMRNGNFFSNLYKLENEDKIELTDFKGNKVEYIVYDKYYIYPTQMESLEQNNKENKEVTLITCNNTSEKRLVIKLENIN